MGAVARRDAWRIATIWPRPHPRNQRWTSDPCTRVLLDTADALRQHSECWTDPQGMPGGVRQAAARSGPWRITPLSSQDSGYAWEPGPT